MEVFIMTDLKDKIKNAKDKIVGEVKEAVGKTTGNESLELKGKIQSSKADINKTMNDAGDKVNEIKEGIAKKINDATDKNEDK
jgi:uncharacterized protein YjbJ (UPF0337 family)